MFSYKLELVDVLLHGRVGRWSVSNLGLVDYPGMGITVVRYSVDRMVMVDIFTSLLELIDILSKKYTERFKYYQIWTILLYHNSNYIIDYKIIICVC